MSVPAAPSGSVQRPSATGSAKGVRHGSDGDHTQAVSGDSATAGSTVTINSPPSRTTERTGSFAGASTSGTDRRRRPVTRVQSRLMVKSESMATRSA